MRTAMFALPAIALGMIGLGAYPFNALGVALLIGWGATEMVIRDRRRRRSRDRSVAEVFNEVVPGDVETALRRLLDALPKTGVRWVRVGRALPRTVRAGMTSDRDLDGDQIEIVLEPLSPAATQLRCVRRSPSRSSGIRSSRILEVAQALGRELGLQVS